MKVSGNRLPGQNEKAPARAPFIRFAVGYGLSYIFLSAFVIEFELAVGFASAVGIVIGIAHGVFRFAECILNFALDFLGCALDLGFAVARPLAGLTFYASGNLVHLAFHAVLIHSSLPWVCNPVRFEIMITAVARDHLCREATTF